MLIYTKIDKEKSVINSAATFCAAAEKIGIYNTQFSLIFEYAEKLIKTENPSVSVSAISNVTGDWYEWLITILGRNFATSTPSNSLLVKLPNVSSFDSTLLYQSQYAELISDFKEKLKITSNVNLVTSNPDFVIMDRALFKSNLHKVEKITPDVLKTLEKDYTNYINSSNLGGIKGYLATKSSLRPDRRIQLLHEGSLMKAIYTHMQTRLWKHYSNMIYALALIHLLIQFQDKLNERNLSMFHG